MVRCHVSNSLYSGCCCCCCCCWCCASQRANETISPTIPLAFRLGSTPLFFLNQSVGGWAAGSGRRSGAFGFCCWGHIPLFLVFWWGREKTWVGDVIDDVATLADAFSEWWAHETGIKIHRKRERSEQRRTSCASSLGQWPAKPPSFLLLVSCRVDGAASSVGRHLADRRHCIRTGAWISFPFHPNGWRKQVNTQSVGEREKTSRSEPGRSR